MMLKSESTKGVQPPQCTFIVTVSIRISKVKLCGIENHNFIQIPAEGVNGVIWSKNLSDFVRIFSIKSFEKINHQLLSISREIERHNFNGTKLRFTGFSVNNLMNFDENNTVITGVHGDMWQALAEMLNFKIQSRRSDEQFVGTRSENGSWDGLLGYVYRNETDIITPCAVTGTRLTALNYTLATWKTGFRFYMKEQPIYYKTWMTELFENRLWLSIIGFFLALTLASFSNRVFNFTNNNDPRDSIYHFRDHVFYIFSIFCNQGWSVRQLEQRSKILIITTRFFSWLLIIAFSSQLTAHIANRKFQPAIDDLESFYKNTDYTLIVKENSLAYSVFQTSRDPIYKTIIDAGRLIQTDYFEAYKKICSGKYVYLESQTVLQAENAAVGKPYFNSWIAGGMVRGFKYRKTIDLGMLKLFEFGIRQRLKSKWLERRKPIKNSGTFESVELQHVSLILAMLVSGLILSLVILLIENIMTHCQLC